MFGHPALQIVGVAGVIFSIGAALDVGPECHGARLAQCVSTSLDTNGVGLGKKENTPFPQAPFVSSEVETPRTITPKPPSPGRWPCPYPVRCHAALSVRP